MLTYIYLGNLCNWGKYSKNNKKYDSYILKFACDYISSNTGK